MRLERLLYLVVSLLLTAIPLAAFGHPSAEAHSHPHDPSIWELALIDAAIVGLVVVISRRRRASH